MKKILLKVAETILGSIGVAVVLWIWFSPNPNSEYSSQWNSREDFEAFVQEDQDQQTFERILEELHHKPK